MAVKRNQKCSVRSFTLGCIEKYAGKGRASVTREGGAYIVRGFTATGKHVAEGVRALSTARQLARKVAK